MLFNILITLGSLFVGSCNADSTRDSSNVCWDHFDESIK